MKTKHLITIAMLVLMPFSFLSCESLPDAEEYDAVLIYDEPYDYTFLRVLEVLNEYPGWVLETTDKAAGMIKVQNMEYSHIFDRDKNIVEFLVKYVNRNQTSIELAPDSQAIEVGKDMMEMIDGVLKSGLPKASEAAGGPETQV